MTSDEQNQGFELGQVYYGANSRSKPDADAPDGEWVHYNFPQWCADVFPEVNDSQGNQLVPTLKEYDKIKEGPHDVEHFIIDMPHKFEDGTDRFAEFFRSSRRDFEKRRPQTVDYEEIDSGLYIFELNYNKLPRNIQWDPKFMRDNEHETAIGLLQSGQLGVIDHIENPHCGFFGDTRSGKTELACLVATQAKLRGCDGMITTPTTNDPSLSMFAEPTKVVVNGNERTVPGWDFVAGLEPEDILAMEAQSDRVMDKIREREEAMASQGGATYRGKRWWWLVDELGSLCTSPKREAKELKNARMNLIDTIEMVAARGAKLNMSVILIAQEPYVRFLGGDGGILSQISVRAGIKKLAKTHHSTVFEQGDGTPVPPHVAKVLSNSKTPYGRAIIRGVMSNPEARFDKTHDTPMQIFQLELKDRRKLLGLDQDEEVEVETNEPFEAVEVGSMEEFEKMIAAPSAIKSLPDPVEDDEGIDEEEDSVFLEDEMPPRAFAGYLDRPKPPRRSLIGWPAAALLACIMVILPLVVLVGIDMAWVAIAVVFFCTFTGFQGIRASMRGERYLMRVSVSTVPLLLVVADGLIGAL